MLIMIKIWHLKTFTVPVIWGALGIIKKETAEHFNKIAGGSSPYEMQKNALCRTAHLLRIFWNS